MKRIERIFIIIIICFAISYSWFRYFNTESAVETQERLLIEAMILMEQGIFVTAEPLLVECITLSETHQFSCEEALKTVYLELIHLSGYKEKYITLMENQLQSKNATAYTVLELAEFYLKVGDSKEAMNILKNGLFTFQSEDIQLKYEEIRYEYKLNPTYYEEVSEIFHDTIQVKKNGFWGIAHSNGSLLLSCQYDKISTYDENLAIVTKENEIYAVDKNGSKVASPKKSIVDFQNFSEGIITMTGENGIYLGDSDLNLIKVEVDEIGTYWNGLAAARVGNLWGMMDSEGKWKIPPTYESISSDNLGKSMEQNIIFVKNNGKFQLLQGETLYIDTYEDAKPFGDYYAAVKNNNLWGFIDSNGTLVIDYQYDNANSFGNHLASVEIDGLWGYISLENQIVIAPIFQEAKSFSGKYAPVKIDDKWYFLELVEENVK